MHTLLSLDMDPTRDEVLARMKITHFDAWERTVAPKKHSQKSPGTRARRRWKRARAAGRR